MEIAKLRDYCLDPLHPRGRQKAGIFSAMLGLTRADAEILQSVLIHAAANSDATPGARDDFGVRYTVDLVLEHKGRRAPIRSA